MSRFPFAAVILLVLPRAAPGSEADVPASGPERNLTFIATSDVHYDAFENEDRNDRVRDTLRHMNGIAGVDWPADLGGGPVEPPRAVLVLGDIIDDGDRTVDGKAQGARQWELYVSDFGFDGTDGILHFPVFEGVGNHDGPPVSCERSGFSFQAELRQRNVRRLERGSLAGADDQRLHTSWDWDGVHFVQLNLYPADRPHPAVKYSPQYHDPQGALSFLRRDLAERVGPGGRPVVLLSHYGFDCDWWHPDDWKALYDAVRPYNIALYIHGHTGTKCYEWKPDGADRPMTVINTGQTENGFFVIQCAGDRLRAAYRAKDWTESPGPDGKPQRTWNGSWRWMHLLDRRIQAVAPGPASPTRG